MRFTTELSKKEFLVLLSMLVVMMGLFTACVVAKDQQIVSMAEPTESPSSTVEPTEEAVLGTEAVESTATPEPTEAVYYSDPNNYIYPFNIMSADWGAELYESGFKYYQIPQEYTDNGGCFPEVVQAYLWSLCEERGIDYYVVVALIETESKYRYDATGDDGNSKGYMQIFEVWHEERMAAEGVTDLFDPYGNIRVGLNFLQELLEKYGDYNKVLVAYNYGESGAKKLFNEGITSTTYSTSILQRAQEIEQELQD